MTDRDELIDRVWRENLQAVQEAKGSVQQARWAVIEAERKTMAACSARRSGPTPKESERLDRVRREYEDAKKKHERAKQQFKAGVPEERLRDLESSDE